jgi:hypothetical protein
MLSIISMIAENELVSRSTRDRQSMGLGVMVGGEEGRCKLISLWSKDAGWVCA